MDRADRANRGYGRRRSHRSCRTSGSDGWYRPYRSDWGNGSGRPCRRYRIERNPWSDGRNRDHRTYRSYRTHRSHGCHGTYRSNRSKRPNGVDWTYWTYRRGWACRTHRAARTDGKSNRTQRFAWRNGCGWPHGTYRQRGFKRSNRNNRTHRTDRTHRS